MFQVGFFDWVNDVLTWIYNLVLWLPRKIFQMFTDGLLALFNSIPVPGFISNASGYLSGISGDVWWWLQAFNFSYGVGVCLAAITLRFLIRRIPFIG